MSRRCGFLMGVAMVAMVLIVSSGHAVSLAGLAHDRGFIQVGNKFFDKFQQVGSIDAVGFFVVNLLHIEVTPFISGVGEGLAFDGLIQANCQLTFPACRTNNDGKSSYIDIFFSYRVETTDGKSFYDMGMAFNGTTSGPVSSAQIIETVDLGGSAIVTAPSTL
ncbi:MAG: hypothetical protein U1A26_03595, partial [Candidatus Sungbacteria bacterium]|nr:hypothetical protein [Candidatus Sungbacteria bacterium]